MSEEEDRNPAQLAADSLYELLSEQSDEEIDDACADTWPGGVDSWLDQDPESAEAAKHREAVFGLIMGELALLCMERALGRHKGREVENG